MQLELQFEDQTAVLRRNLDEISLCGLIWASRRRLEGLPEQFGLQYVDNEGDVVDIICEEDFQTLKETLKNEKGRIVIKISSDGYPVMVDSNRKREECHKVWEERKHHFSEKGKEFIKNTLKSMIPEIVQCVRAQVFNEKQEELEKQAKAIHLNFQCNGCNAMPIVGIRYKCSVCADFDFCEKCENEKQHDHIFLKMKKPESQFISKVNSQKEVPRYRRNFMVGDVEKEIEWVPKVPIRVEKQMDEEFEIILTAQQEQNLVQLSNLLSINAVQLRQAMIEFDGFPVDEIALYLTENPEIIAQLKIQKYH